MFILLSCASILLAFFLCILCREVSPMREMLLVFSAHALRFLSVLIHNITTHLDQQENREFSTKNIIFLTW